MQSFFGFLLPKVLDEVLLTWLLEAVTEASFSRHFEKSGFHVGKLPYYLS